MLICNESQCTGCMSCYNACPKHCISMNYNSKGILIPNINENNCIHCNICSNTCPANKNIKTNQSMEAYACWSLDENDRCSSSSGGLASIFYTHFIEIKKGTVYGCSYDENLQLMFSSANTLEEISKYKGSKYSQSYIGNSYKEIRDLLENKIEVLFIGTPCQVAGLKCYLRNEYQNLTTVDLVCHGVPSQKYIDEYVKSLNLNIYPDNISFRGFRNFYFTLYKNSKVIYSEKSRADQYFSAFLDGLFYRESCYECKYANSSRIGDITIGDFWGLGTKIQFEHDQSKGVSLALINTQKGKELFENIKNNIFCEKRTIEEALEGNHQLNHPSIKNKNYDKFLKLYTQYGCEYALKECIK